MKNLYSDLIHFAEFDPTVATSEEWEIYKSKTLEFCNQWRSGQETFELKTSGSTGIPKKITVTRQQIRASVSMTQQALGLQPGDVALGCLNIDFIAGKMMLARALEIQMPIYISLPSSNPFLLLPENLKIDFTAMVPYQVQTILEKSPEKLSILNSLKALIIGGAPVSDTLQQALQAVESPVYSTYGMTETVSHIALRKLNGPTASETYRALPEIELTLDSRNCLNIKGQVTNNETIATNDVVELLDDNNFIWKGRFDNIINSGGIKIQTEELESRLTKIFQQLEIPNRFIISSINDKTFGSVVILILEGEIPEDKKDQLIHSQNLNLSKYEIPKNIFFVERFEETSSGKIDRNRTKALIPQKSK